MPTLVRRLLFPLRTFACVAPLAVLGALLAAGCGKPKPTEPVPLIDQACCAEAEPKLAAFKGCILGRRNCPKSHKWWMRGQVECGAVDETNCLGGRCCTYRAQYDASVGEPLEDWRPPGWPAPDKPADPAPDKPAEPEPADPEPPSEPEPPAVAAEVPTVTVTISGDGTPAIDGESLDLAAFKTRICDARKALPKLAVHVRAEADTAYDAVASVLSAISACGVTSVRMDQTTD